MPRKLTHFKNYFDKEFKTNKFLEHINFMILYLGELIYLYINDMSNILRSKQGNLSKIKYFLPTYHHQQPDTALLDKNQNKKAQNRKQSVSNIHTRSLNEQSEISFEIVGISEAEEIDKTGKNSKENRENNIMRTIDLPKKPRT
jgi:hypothetical protein